LSSLLEGTDDAADEIARWVRAWSGRDAEELTRDARWRPAWTVRLEGDDEPSIWIRGERGPEFSAPYSLEHETIVHGVLREHGVAAPEVFGVIDTRALHAIAMELVPGRHGGALVDAEDRDEIIKQYVEQLAAMHAIEPTALAAAGLEVPTGDDFVRSDLYRRAERDYLASKTVAAPELEFLRWWLACNQPAVSLSASLVAFDAGQFLHFDGRITGLIDFELAHVGTPAMDLASLWLRDAVDPIADIRRLLEEYERRTGVTVDRATMQYFVVLSATVTCLLQHAPATAPAGRTDLVSYLTWYLDTARYAYDVIAAVIGVEIAPIELPAPRQDRYSSERQHLLASLKAESLSQPSEYLRRHGVAVHAAREIAPSPAASAFDRWRRRCDYRLARHLHRVDEIGEKLAAEDLTEAGAVLGYRPNDWVSADRALEALVADATPTDAPALVGYFARRLERQHQLLGPADSLIVRHPPLQELW
jgi:aminoglycoside phosphotransferase (APT) family kinase protein